MQKLPDWPENSGCPADWALWRAPFPTSLHTRGAVNAVSHKAVVSDQLSLFYCRSLSRAGAPLALRPALGCSDRPELSFTLARGVVLLRPWRLGCAALSSADGGCS